MTKIKLLLSVAAASVLLLNGCVDVNRNDTLNVNYDGTDDGSDSGATGFCTDENTISGFIDTDLELTQDTCLDGKVQVTQTGSITANNITIAGKADTKAWLEVVPGGQLFSKNVLFTSEEEASGGTGKAGDWGGVTLIGNDNTDEEGTAINSQLEGYEVDDIYPGIVGELGDMNDNSGSIIDCTFNNTGIAVQDEKEINGLSFVGVGSGTTISGITVNRAGDDAVEIWGGHVVLTDVTIVGAGDDGFDNDDGWAGSVTGLSVSGAANSGLELSGNTHATYTDVSIDTSGTLAADDVGGAIYLKKTAIGGYFYNVNIIDNQTNIDSQDVYGTIVTDAADLDHLEGDNIVISGSNTAGSVTEGPNYDANVSTTTEVATALGL